MPDPSRDEDMLIVRTREAHEAIKDLKVVLKEVKETIAEGERVRTRIIEAYALAAPELIDARIESAITDGLEAYAKSVSTAIRIAENAVYERFEALREWLLEGDTLDKADQRRQLEEMQDTLDKRIQDRLRLQSD